MGATATIAPTGPRRDADLARHAEYHCHRALRRLDALIRERDDVLLAAAREEVRRAALRMAQARER
jgi:hypothetical protein